MKFGEIESGDRFEHDGSVWEKRHDGLGADLVSSDGSISFIGGRRCIREFDQELKVDVSPGQLIYRECRKEEAEFEEAVGNILGGLGTEGAPEAYEGLSKALELGNVYVMADDMILKISKAKDADIDIGDPDVIASIRD